MITPSDEHQMYTHDLGLEMLRLGCLYNSFEDTIVRRDMHNGITYGSSKTIIIGKRLDQGENTERKTCLISVILVAHSSCI